MDIEKICKDLAPRKFGPWGVVWTTALVIVTGLGIYSYIRQLQDGMSVTGLNDYAFWGIYISNFVFFVAISFVGALVSAIMRLLGKKWAVIISRIAEMIAFSAILMASLIIIVDMGRPERLVYLFVHGRLQSPIVWDVVIVTTYLAISALLMYFTLVPDFALLRDRYTGAAWLKKIYTWLALNWKGSAVQKKIKEQSIFILVVLIIPCAFAILSIDSWLFATTFRPGWDSTSFGPYFIAGAVVVGSASVIAAMYVFRRSYKLENYITDELFDKMGKVLVMLCLVYLYFNLNEYMIPAYKLKKAEEAHIYGMLFGHYSLMFYSAIGFGLVMPVILLIFKKMREPRQLFVISIIVVVAAWWKRYLIVTPTLLHPHMPIQGVPESWTNYWPTYHEWMVTCGTLALGLLIITILVRYIPVIPMAEYHEYINESKNEK